MEAALKNLCLNFIFFLAQKETNGKQTGCDQTQAGRQTHGSHRTDTGIERNAAEGCYEIGDLHDQIVNTDLRNLKGSRLESSGYKLAC